MLVLHSCTDLRTVVQLELNLPTRILDTVWLTATAKVKREECRSGRAYMERVSAGRTAKEAQIHTKNGKKLVF